MSDKPEQPTKPDDSTSGAAEISEQREEAPKPVSTVVPGADFTIKPRIEPQQD